MKILDNGSIGSPSPREIVLNGEDVEKLVSSGELQAGPVLLKFERTAGEGFSFGVTRGESWTKEESGSGSSKNWSSNVSWSSSTGTSRSSK